MTGAARIPAGLELRASAEVRAAAGRRLEGVAAVYGVPTDLGGGITETLRVGCFAASLNGGADVLFLADHDFARVLGRTKSGTLTLRDTPTGLAFSVVLPDTSAGRDAWELASRGDMGGASVGMRVRSDRWEGNRRLVVEAELVECSAVASHAAYPQTVVQARSRLAAPPAARAALRRRLMVEAL
jgi:HK97 family phage prohead protease